MRWVLERRYIARRSVDMRTACHALGGRCAKRRIRANRGSGARVPVKFTLSGRSTKQPTDVVTTERALALGHRGWKKMCTFAPRTRLHRRRRHSRTAVAPASRRCPTLRPHTRWLFSPLQVFLIKRQPIVNDGGDVCVCSRWRSSASILSAAAASAWALRYNH